MSKKRFVLDNLLNPAPVVQCFLAQVVSVGAQSCTVRLIHSDLEVEDVSLVAQQGGSSSIVLKPQVESFVLVGCVENEISNLYIAQYGEIDGGSILIGNSKIDFTTDEISLINDKSKVVLNEGRALLSQDETLVELKNKKVSISSGSLNLKSIFDDLATLLNGLIVLTPQGPSTGLGPNSITAVTNLKTKVAQLLA